MYVVKQTTALMTWVSMNHELDNPSYSIYLHAYLVPLILRSAKYDGQLGVVTYGFNVRLAQQLAHKCPQLIGMVNIIVCYLRLIWVN